MNTGDICASKCCRRTKQKSNLYQPVSNTLAGQTLIYMQMSNHYRRLENAKSIVDSGLTSGAVARRSWCDTNSFKNYQPPSVCEFSSGRYANPSTAFNKKNYNIKDFSSSYSPSPSDMDLVDQIVYDNKHKPNAFYRDSKGTVFAPTSHTKCVKIRDAPNPKSKRNPINARQQSRSKSPSKSVRSYVRPTVPMDILDHHNQKFEPGKNFRPRILKSNTPSMVHDMPVYRAPCKRPQHLEGNLSNGTAEHKLQDKPYDEINQTVNQPVHLDDPWDFPDYEINSSDVEKAPSSKGSSASFGHDSAYCGGVSSGEGSRGTTPVQLTTEMKTMGAEEMPPSCEDNDCCPQSCTKIDEDDDYYPRKGNQETAYATFLRDLTEDILDRGIFTDKGINSIFQRHIEEHMNELDQDRLLMEVSDLRKKLGIAEDSQTVGFSDNYHNNQTNPVTMPRSPRKEVKCLAICATGNTGKSIPDNRTTKEKKTGIEDMISEMEHCVKIDVHALDSACVCQKGERKIGCQCAESQAQGGGIGGGQFFDVDHAGAMRPQVIPTRSHDGVMGQQMSYDPKPMNTTYNETDQDRRATSDFDDEDFIADTDMQVVGDDDSFESGHVDSICKTLGTNSNDKNLVLAQLIVGVRAENFVPKSTVIKKDELKTAPAPTVPCKSGSDGTDGEVEGDDLPRVICFNGPQAITSSIDIVSESLILQEKVSSTEYPDSKRRQAALLQAIPEEEKKSSRKSGFGANIPCVKSQTSKSNKSEDGEFSDSDTNLLGGPPGQRKKGCFAPCRKKKVASLPSSLNKPDIPNNTNIAKPI